jgi:hypothetical protein
MNNVLMNNVTIMSVNKLIDDMNSYANHVISFGDGCVYGKHHSNPFYKYGCFQIQILKK